MAAERACFACSQPLLVLSRGEARCSPGCPGGGRFARCGFCHEISFALGKPETPYCYNPDCRMHGRTRRRCDDCNQVSQIEVAEHRVCLNRRCPKNEGQLTTCAICAREGRSEPSFMSVGGLSFCGRGACEALLIAVEPCPWCGRRTRAVEEKTCCWPDCEAYGLEQTICGRCGGPALVDADGGEPRCKRDDCAPGGIDAEALTPDMTIMDLWAAAPIAKERSQVLAAAAPRAQEGGPHRTGRSGGPASRREDAGARAEPAGPHMQQSRTRPVSGGGERSGPPPAGDDATLDDLPVLPEAGAADSPLDVTLPDGMPAAAAPTAPPKSPAPAPPPKPAPPKPLLPAPATTDAIPVGGVTIFEHTTPPPSRAPRTADIAKAKLSQPVATPAKPAPAVSPAAPAPVPAAASATGPVAPPAKRPPPADSPLGLALGVLEDDLMGDAPLAVILGAIGSGKTTFLTTLGHMLAARDAAYHFPYAGLTVRRVNVADLLDRRTRRGQGALAPEARAAVEQTVRDLAHDFAQPLYDTSLAVGAWPPPTRPEDARILVADLVRNLQPCARLVTAEVPGEALEEALRDQAANRPSRDPMAGAAAWLLERGERLVLLLDPTAERTDALYEGLFRVLRDALAPRALNAVARKVRERLEARGQRGIIDEFERAAARHDRATAEREAALRLQKEWEQRVRGLGEGVAGADPRAALATNEATLRRLEQAWRQVFPQEYQQATAYVREREFSLEAIVVYCRGLVKNTMTPQRWGRLAPALVQMELAAGDKTHVTGGNEREIAQVANEVLAGEGLPPEVRIDLAGDLRTDRVTLRYPRLRSIAICVTKSDAIPLVHPPSDDPPRRFPRMAGPLREVEAYLELDGGTVRYYHTSATGYSLDSGVGRVPGPAGSCTPVNVCEPVLDGLIG